jgi:tetrahydromethanopterin S-methyltransferase subunit F
MNTTADAHKRLDRIEPKVEQIDRDVASLKTEVRIQFKEVFARVKRLEAILVASAGTIITMLVAILLKLA